VWILIMYVSNPPSLFAMFCKVIMGERDCGLMINR